MNTCAATPLDCLEFIDRGLDRPMRARDSHRRSFCVDRQVRVIRMGYARESIAGAPDGFLPNGFAMLPGRQFLLANMSPQSGGAVWTINRNRMLRPWLLQADDQDLPHASLVLLDAQGRVWITLSTGLPPRQRAHRANVAEGVGYARVPRAGPGRRPGNRGPPGRAAAAANIQTRKPLRWLQHSARPSSRTRATATDMSAK